MRFWRKHPQYSYQTDPKTVSFKLNKHVVSLTIKFSSPLNNNSTGLKSGCLFRGILPMSKYEQYYFVLLLGGRNILPCPGTTQSARSSTFCLLSVCLRSNHQCEIVMDQFYFSSSSEPADFHRSGSCRSSSFSKLSPAMTTVPCSLVPVTTTKLMLSRA